MFCVGNPHRLSHTFTVLSNEPETKIFECYAKRTLLAHFEWPLYVATGLEVSRRSHILSWPSSWADKIDVALLSRLVTTESLVRIVSVLYILTTSVKAISWALEAETTS